MKPIHATCALLAVLLAALPATPASAVTDHKSIHGSQCVAGGGSTTSAELSFGSFGVSNPGTTDETIICPLPIDIEQPWQQTGTDPTTVYVHYRSGSVPGRIICTAYSGSIAAQPGAVTSFTSTSGTQAANSVVSVVGLGLPGANWQGDAPPAPVVSLVCVLGPKMKIGGIFMLDRHETHRP